MRRAPPLQESLLLVQSHDTGGRVALQALALGGAPWATAVGPRWPAPLAEPARVRQAWQRGRGRAPPPALWRGVVASGWGPRSTRRGGAWAGLTGRPAIAEAAGRQRRRARHAWRLGRLGAVVAPEAAPRGPPRAGGRAAPRAADLLVGRRPQGGVTERRGGAPVAR